MEVRFNISDEAFMERLQTMLHAKTSAEVVKHSLTLLNWAMNEIARDRIILSSDQKGQNVHRLVMPALDSVRPATPQFVNTSVAR